MMLYAVHAHGETKSVTVTFGSHAYQTFKTTQEEENHGLNINKATAAPNIARSLITAQDTQDQVIWQPAQIMTPGSTHTYTMSGAALDEPLWVEIEGEFVKAGGGAGGAGAQKPDFEITVLKVEFKESAVNNGFDDTTHPRWLVVPVNNSPNTKMAVAEITPSSGASHVDFQVANTNKATVSPATAFSASQTATLTGQAKGETALDARTGGSVCTTLNLAVKDKKSVKVAIHFMKDNAGHSTTTSDADAIINHLNTVFTPQANVVFVKHSADSPTVPKDLGPVVEWYATEPANEWDDVVTAARDATADVNLYFVWEYEQDGTPDTDNANAGTLGTDCLIEDNRGTRTIPHEVGHALGLADRSSGDTRALMWFTATYSDTKIIKVEVDTVNP